MQKAESESDKMKVSTLALFIQLVCIISSIAHVSGKTAAEKNLERDGYTVLRLDKQKRLITRDAHTSTDAKADEAIPAEAGLKHGLIDAEIQDKLGSIKLGKSTMKRQKRYKEKSNLGAMSLSKQKRSRRNQDELDIYARKAEENALASAAESVAAEENSVAAAIETEQARQESHDSSENNAINQNQDWNESKFGENSKLSSSQTEGDNDNFSIGEYSSESDELNSEAKSNLDSPMKKLMSQSSELAREIRMVFRILAKREQYLVNEMDKLRISLSQAIDALKESESDMVLRRKRRDKQAKNVLTTAVQAFTKADKPNLLARTRRQDPLGGSVPYRACVYIDVPQQQESSLKTNQENTMLQENMQKLTGNYIIPTETEEESQPPPDYEENPIPQDSLPNGRAADSSLETNSESQSLSQSESGTEGIDLSSIYWLELPANGGEQSIYDKVNRLLSGVRTTGRDVLIIPVSRGFHTNEEITNGFLRAVRVSPASLQSRYLKNYKRLNIRRI